MLTRGSCWTLQEAIEAYGQATKQTLPPRDLEASLLLKAASQLQELKENWTEAADRLEGALHFNRRLWTIFVTSVADADNPLPQPIKNNIASLGVFIFRHTLSIQSKPAPEKLTVLIDINRAIAAGLHARQDSEIGDQTSEAWAALLAADFQGSDFSLISEL